MQNKKLLEHIECKQVIRIQSEIPIFHDDICIGLCAISTVRIGLSSDINVVNVVVDVNVAVRI